VTCSLACIHDLPGPRVFQNHETNYDNVADAAPEIAALIGVVGDVIINAEEQDKCQMLGECVSTTLRKICKRATDYLLYSRFIQSITFIQLQHKVFNGERISHLR
jgi:hypothetical protein